MMDYMGGLQTVKRSAENSRIDARLRSLLNTPTVCLSCTGAKTADYKVTTFAKLVTLVQVHGLTPCVFTFQFFSLS